MLYMTILTWEPAQRDAVIKRFATQGPKLPAGVKLLGMWAAFHGSRVFSLEEWPPAHDPKLVIEANFAWTDLCKIEAVPVMEAQEMMKLLPKA
jgi:hypothetical protein